MTKGDILADIVNWPVLLAYKAGIISFETASAILGGIPYRIGSVLRRSLLRHSIKHCGRQVGIGDNSIFRFDDPKLLSIGDNTKIERDVHIGDVMPCTREVRIGRDCIIRDHARIGAYGGPVTVGDGSGIGFGCMVRGPVQIGSDSGIAQYTSLMGVTHFYYDPDDSFRNKDVILKPIVIGDNVWVGGNCMIVAGVKIGRNCVIGANSVVTRDVPDYCLAVGAPAKVIKRYDREKDEWVRAGKP